MINADWKYYILEEDGRSGRIVNGVVSFLGTPAWLPQAPDGNQDIALVWERNMTRYGPMRNFSLPLGFVLDGATILRDGLYRSNVDRKLFLLIQRRVLELDPVYYKDYYKYFYKGQFDFTTAEDRQGDQRFEINLMEGGLWKALKAREDQVYTVPFDEDAINIYMDGVDIDGSFTYLMPADANVGSLPSFLPGVSLLGQEGSAVGLVPFTTFKSTESIDADNTDYFLEATQVVNNIRLTGKIIVTNLLNNDDVVFNLVKFNANTLVSTAYNLFTGTVGTNDTHTIDLDAVPQVFSVVAGDRLFFEMTVNDEVLGNAFGVQEGQVKFTYTSKFAATYVKAFTPYTLFRKLIEKITGNPDDASSVILQSSPYNLTSGDGLRGFDNAAIKTSLKDFFTAFNVYHMLGMGVENDKIIIEERAHFFQYGNPVDCGNAKDFVISPSTDLFFSRLKIGHAEQNIDDVNGKYDFNGQYNYGSPIESVSKDLELVSPYKAGPYEIEITRSNFEGKTTTDGENDNSVYVIDSIPDATTYEDNFGFLDASGVYFLLYLDEDIQFVVGQVVTTNSVNNPGPFTITAITKSLNQLVLRVAEPVTTEISAIRTITIEQGGIYQLDRSIVVTSGVPSPSTIFNVRLSPARLLRVHGGWLRGILEGYQADRLKFNSTNRNADLVAGGITENADVPVNTLNSAMLSPWYFEYGTQVPIALIEELELDPNRSYAGDWEGTPFEGFGITTGLAPNTREEQKFKILAIPGTDIKKFIT